MLNAMSRYLLYFTILAVLVVEFTKVAEQLDDPKIGNEFIG